MTLKVKGEQRNWRCGAKCAGLWFAGGDSNLGPSLCPADHGLHSDHPSGKYSVRWFTGQPGHDE